MALWWRVREAVRVDVVEVGEEVRKVRWFVREGFEVFRSGDGDGAAV